MIIQSRSKTQRPSITAGDKDRFLNRKREVDARLKARQAEMEVKLLKREIDLME